MTLAEKIIAFNKNLRFEGTLPPSIKIMNPFTENPHALEASSTFYRKFYNDTNPRKLIMGINPGRFGAGVTGVSFTDTKRLEETCGISIAGIETYELSSVFIYEMIEAYGSVKEFYSDYYINSPSPLGYVKENKTGKEVNFNYYDSAALTKSATPFILNSLRQHAEIASAKNSVCFCLGTGKNYHHLLKFNSELNLFSKIIPLEHPRYIMQYKLKKKEFYIEKYIKALKEGCSLSAS